MCAYPRRILGDSDVGDIVVGDLKLVTSFECWTPTSTHFVSNIRHQHQCHPYDMGHIEMFRSHEAKLFQQRPRPGRPDQVI